MYELKKKKNDYIHQVNFFFSIQNPVRNRKFKSLVAIIVSYNNVLIDSRHSRSLVSLSPGLNLKKVL